MAERQAARRVVRKKAKALEAKGERRDQLRQRGETMKQIKDDLHAARKNRREDWELGPLAPRRETAKLNDAGRTFYGSVAMDRNSVNTKLSKKELDERTAWAGGIQFLNLTAGDRVVVIEGPYKGRIAPIKRVIKANAQVQLDDSAIMVSCCSIYGLECSVTIC